jgi:hypothetical protein
MRSAFARECAADSAGPDLMRPQAEQKSCNGARLGGLRPLVGGAVGVQHVQREVDEEEAPVGRLALDGDVVAVERAAAGAMGQVRRICHGKLLLLCDAASGALL